MYFRGLSATSHGLPQLMKFSYLLHTIICSNVAVLVFLGYAEEEMAKKLALK